jgi:hypothetical protein
MTWFGWLGLMMMVVFGGVGIINLFAPERMRIPDAQPFGLAAFGFALLVWGAVAY